MSIRIVSVQELLRVRNCRGRNCTSDAETGDGYCADCDRKLRLGLDVEHEPAKREPLTLRCRLCGQHRPDNEFSACKEKPRRRFRNEECRDCNAKRSREYRAANLELVRKRDRERKRKLKLKSSLRVDA